MTRTLAWVTALLFGVMSAYGWWFHFNVGPTHGPGVEFGVIAGVVALAAAALGSWLKWRDRKH